MACYTGGGDRKLLSDRVDSISLSEENELPVEEVPETNSDKCDSKKDPDLEKFKESYSCSSFATPHSAEDDSPCAADIICSNTLDSDAQGFSYEASNLVLDVNAVNKIEMQLAKYERVSLAFLFFDDVEVCLKYCNEALKRQNFRGLTKHTTEDISVWSMKLLECLFRLQNYFLLERLGMDKFLASNIFQKTSFISPERLLMYYIFESVTSEEGIKLMKSVPSLPVEEYLEIFFLKLKFPEQWVCFRNSLKSSISSSTLPYMEDFDKLLASKLEISPQPQKSVTNESKTYPIKDPNNVGVCIILNQVEFQNNYKRLGSEIDVQSLESTMNDFNFTVVTKHSQPLKFFKEEFRKLVCESFKSNHSIFFLVILSHGAEGFIYTSDDHPVSIRNDFFSVLASIKCLKGIPKVIIVQACQGDKFLKSDNVATDGILLSNAQTDVPHERPDMSGIVVGDYISDTLLVMSTVPGFKSFRQTDRGSPFIQYLCQCLREYPNKSFENIITEVKSRVNEKVVRTKVKGLNFVQRPESSSLLTKKLYLKPLNK